MLDRILPRWPSYAQTAPFLSTVLLGTIEQRHFVSARVRSKGLGLLWMSSADERENFCFVLFCFVFFLFVFFVWFFFFFFGFVFVVFFFCFVLFVLFFLINV